MADGPTQRETPGGEGRIERLDGRTVYENPWLTLREDRVRFTDGHEGIYGVVDRTGSVAVLPLHEDGTVTLVEQFRYTVGGRYWELPQGSRSPAHGADPAASARAELAEEAGLAAARLDPVGALWEAYGFACQEVHCFLATGLTEVSAARDATEADMVIGRFTLEEVRAMVAAGRIRDNLTLAVIGLLALQGRIGAQAVTSNP